MSEKNKSLDGKDIFKDERTGPFLKFLKLLRGKLSEMNIDSDLIGRLMDEGLIEVDSENPVLKVKLTPGGMQYIDSMDSPKQGNANRNTGDFSFLENWGSKNAFIRGASKDYRDTPLKKVSEDIIYRFLKFHAGVLRRTKSPYLRELVAEDYLIDKEGLTYAQAAELIEDLVKEGILEYDQFGAFPGTGMTEKGYDLLKELEKKYG